MPSTLPLTQIAPDHPVVWENETTIRVGFDRALARVAASSPASQVVIAKLIRGATKAELAESGTRVVDRVLADLSPVLRYTAVAQGGARQRLAEGVGAQHSGSAGFTPAAELRASPKLPAPPALQGAAGTRVRTAGVPTLTARLSDDGREVPGLRAALEGPGACDLRRTTAQPDLVIEVHRFLEPLGRTARWLRAGIPHLMLRFTDDAARIGPLVAPDGAPCHGCEGLHLTDADPALPAIASQLYGTVPSSETPEVAQLTAAVAVYFLSAWRRRERWVHDRQLELPVAGGTLSAFPKLTRIRTHTECGCAISARPRPPPQIETARETPGPRSRTPRGAARRAHE
ncbi:hypothetical protein FB468_1040 [Leucobacter komagatae]|uniref:Bacteriocin biosynthesis cyclodehydratase domain-containing protein n=1 Tax=Leucobacter komagatae TaxID=55969 RepID=A0A542Y4M6_9MICO|nr:hypothetical protein [Leucobacter komagatae]TQL43026.1 hypothetical protein FB468_1040 [Leucobacter komagatae]